MSKRKTSITYVDTETGRAHTFPAEVAPGATRKEIAARLAKHLGVPAGQIRITRGV